MFCASCWRQCRCLLSFLFRRLGTGLESIAVISGLQNVAAVGEAIEQRGGHFGVPKNGGPFREAQVGGDDDAGALIELAQEMEQQSAAAMERATRVAVERQLASIGEAGEAAADAAARVSERLTQQMLAIADSTASVESRLQDARAERENADQETLARRVSLLIESLNSASIDIAKTFSTDVSDSAWSAYLKGDRGVFTRRAVRLLDSAEAREIARLHEEDPAFREQVNRYIHDFEAMLRTILSQRDGSPLGVTILSSDMGKLYVALAQAIERLRA